jgi:hypothetical protein
MKTYGQLKYDSAKRQWLASPAPHVALRMKRVFPKISQYTVGVLALKDTIETARDLEWFIERYPLECADTDFLKQRAAAHREKEALVTKLLSADCSKMDFPMALPPRDYQKQAAALVHANGNLLLADDVGLGKTVSAIAAFVNPKLRPVLVVTLAHLPRQWMEFLRRFAPFLSCRILQKSTPYDLRLRNDAMPDVIISSYHKLHGWAETLGPVLKSIVWDEVQELRHADTGKYNAAKYLADLAPYKMGLSATPIYNYGQEIFNVLECIAPGELGSRQEFLTEWCPDYQCIKDPRAFGVYMRESGLMLRRTRADVGRELPALSIMTQEIETDEKALSTMEKGCDELARIILSKSAEAHKGQKMQAAAEFDMRMRQATGIAKAPYVAAFVEILLEQGEQVVVYAWHRECFGRGTPVLMFDGSIKPVEQISVDDLVMGPDSKPRRVVNLTSGSGQLFKVNPIKGDSWTCSSNHLLALHRPGKNYVNYKTIAAKDFATFPETRRNRYQLYRAEAVTFPQQKPVFEPWLMGCWLGDGASSLTDFRIANEDQEVFAELRRICRKYGLRLGLHDSKGVTGKSKCKALRMAYAGSSKCWHRNLVLNEFKKLNLRNNKHIPHSYKTCSLNERRELLAGLLDSDGHVYHGNGAGTADVTTKWEHLADDIIFLCRSLGLAAYKSSSTRATNYHKVPTRYFRVSISGDLTNIPTRISRKKAPVRRQIKSVLRTGLSLSDYGMGDFFGFETDGDHLFLLGDFTVVHNCYAILQERLRHYNPVMYTGSESASQKERAKVSFLSGHSKVLLISLRSGAGLDGLQDKCKTVVFAELDWSPGVHEQNIGRIYRDGQKHPVFAYYLLSESGSDPIVADVLGLKKQQIEGIKNPTGELVEQLSIDPHHIKKLAEAYLRKKGSA